MTNFTKTMIMAVVSLTLAGAASAQTMKAEIPFSFRIGDKVMAPGPYLLEMKSNNGIDIFRLYNVEQKDSALSVPNLKHDPSAEWKADGRPRLAFECGSHCALAEVYTGAATGVSYKISHPKTHGEDVRMAVIVAQPAKAD